MKTTVKNIDMKSTSFKATKTITGTIHLMATAIADTTLNLEAKIGNKLGQGKVEDLKKTRIAITKNRLDKVNDLAADWKAKFEEAKAKRQSQVEAN